MAARLLKCLPGGFLGRTAVLRSQSQAEFFDNLHAFFDGLRAREYRGRDLDQVRELNGGQNTEVVFGKDYKG
jgi:hypothetical protein